MKLVLIFLILNYLPSLSQVVEPPSVEFPNFDKPTASETVVFGGPEPEFPGGWEALKKHIVNYEHPGWKDEERTKSGYVCFVVEADGRLMDIHVLRHVSPELDDLMLRIVEEMPRWIPACDRNDCYRSRVRLPITFVYSDE